MASAFTTLIPHSTGNSSHSDQTRKRNKSHPSWEGRSEILIICRWHDSVHRKPHRLQKKVLNLIRECGRVVTTESTFKINGILVHKQWNIRNQEKNPIWYSNKKNKVPRNRPKQGGKRPVLRKLHNTEERN